MRTRTPFFLLRRSCLHSLGFVHVPLHAYPAVSVLLLLFTLLVTLLVTLLLLLLLLLFTSTSLGKR